MPGLVVFKRRWAVASDDFVLPALILLVVHLTWLVVMTIVLAVAESRDWRAPCMSELYENSVGYIVILAGCVVVEAFILRTSMKGGIMQVESRRGLDKLIYIRVVLFAVEIIWLVVGVVWIRQNYSRCLPNSFAKDAMLGLTITNWIVLLAVILTIICSFDWTGRSFLERRRRYKNRGRRRSEMESSWGKRCRLLVCCLSSTDRHHGSLAQVVNILSNFFDDVDLVPSDIIAGFVILRKLQHMHRRFVIEDERNQIYDFLSGVSITPDTRFVDITDDEEIAVIQDLIHYMRYCLSSYGWPVAVISRSRACFDLCPFLRCSSLCTARCCPDSQLTILGDNACHCNEAAFKHLFKDLDCNLLYAKYNVQIGEPSFSVAIDYEKQAIVITVRGTMSLEDLITDLNAEADVLPLDPVQEDWLGHRGMTQAAEYIKKQLLSRGLLRQAFLHAIDRGSASYKLILVGHSLGAGTASILALLLRGMYPNLHCYAFSPPGGLLSPPAALFSRPFITSVVVGKDVIPRLGLHQIKEIQKDILAALTFCSDPKWKVIGLSCCPFAMNDAADEEVCQAVEFWRKKSHSSSSTSSCQDLTDDGRCLLFPPGKILHVVRSHPEEKRDRRDAVHQALWSDHQDFREILVSPVMVHDHLPHHVLAALESLLVKTGPPKPNRLPNIETTAYSFPEPIYTSIAPVLTVSCGRTPTPDSLDTQCTQKIVMETSFTDLRPASLADECNYSKTSDYGKPSFRSALRHHRKMDLFRHDWIRSAPLASPENMSLTSSLVSPVLPNICSSLHRNPILLSSLQDHNRGSQLSMQDLIDVFSEGSDTRSLEDMVSDAKRDIDVEGGEQQLNKFKTTPSQNISILY